MKVTQRYEGEIMAYHDVKKWIIETIKDLKVKDMENAENLENSDSSELEDENDIQIID